MRSPPESATASDEEEPPALGALDDPETLLQGERTRDDFLSAALQLREPTTVPEIAERAGRGVDAAREYMRWFETIGLVRAVEEGPEQYETNPAYLYWRRVDEIRRTYAEAEIVDHLDDLLEELDGFEDRYNTADPTAVDLVTAAEERDESVARIWEHLSRWKTLLARRNLLEDALHRAGDRYRNPSRDDSRGSNAVGSV